MGIEKAMQQVTNRILQFQFGEEAAFAQLLQSIHLILVFQYLMTSCTRIPFFDNLANSIEFELMLLHHLVN